MHSVGQRPAQNSFAALPSVGSRPSVFLGLMRRHTRSWSMFSQDLYPSPCSSFRSTHADRVPSVAMWEDTYSVLVFLEVHRPPPRGPGPVLGPTNPAHHPTPFAPATMAAELHGRYCSLSLSSLPHGNSNLVDLPVALCYVLDTAATLSIHVIDPETEDPLLFIHTKLGSILCSVPGQAL